MDQEFLLEAISDHLDTLSQMVNWAVLISTAVCWAGIRRQREVEAVGVKLERKHAFYAMAALYSVANLAVFLVFWRLRQLLTLIDDDHFKEAFTRVAIHPWVLNPFSYYGSGGSVHLLGSEGVGLLIVVWWLCNSSLYTLVEKHTRKTTLLLGIFLGVGAVALITIELTNILLIERMARVNSSISDHLKSLSWFRFTGNFIGICVGALIYSAANRLQAQWRGDNAPDTRQTSAAST